MTDRGETRQEEAGKSVRHVAIPATTAPWGRSASSGSTEGVPPKGDVMSPTVAPWSIGLVEPQQLSLEDRLSKARAARPQGQQGGEQQDATANPPAEEGDWKEVAKLSLVVDGKPVTYGLKVPYKWIKTHQDLETFKKSKTYNIIKEFILSLNHNCMGKKIDDPRTISPSCSKVIDVLKKMSSWVDEIPPIKQPMRYGNKAFRDWMDKVAEEVPKLVEEMLPDEIKAAAVEATPYLLGSLGDKTRIDYGTGHEQMFICFLALLAKINFFKDEDADALALNVFWEYLQLVRRLQLAYRLEPAGSHGCWSLDDYQFIPFLWGSAQLMNHPTLVPSSIHEDWVVNANANSYFYFHCVQFIRTVKSGSLSENSPMLNDISGITTWPRVNNGMCKMFFAEVMDKFPVMQHMLFGGILPEPEEEVGSSG